MLAARYSVDPVTILAANNLNDPDMLQIGQELIILPTDGVLYTLRPGESIRRVAEGYGVPIDEIISANELGSSPDVVQPGTQLVVPGATPAWPRTSSDRRTWRAGAGRGLDRRRREPAARGGRARHSEHAHVRGAGG